MIPVYSGITFKALLAMTLLMLVPPASATKRLGELQEENAAMKLELKKLRGLLQDETDIYQYIIRPHHTGKVVRLKVIKEFTFFMKMISTERQGKKDLDVVIKYRFTTPVNYKEIRYYMALEISNKDTFTKEAKVQGWDGDSGEWVDVYDKGGCFSQLLSKSKTHDKDGNPTIEENNNKYRLLAADVWWEELSEALSRNIIDKWSGITAVSLSIEVHEDIENSKVKYRQPSQHGCIITIGDITPLQPAPLVVGKNNFVPGSEDHVTDDGTGTSTSTNLVTVYYGHDATKFMINDPTPGVKITVAQLDALSREDGIYTVRTAPEDVCYLQEKCKFLSTQTGGKMTYSMLVKAAREVPCTGTEPIHPAFIAMLQSKLEPIRKEEGNQAVSAVAEQEHIREEEKETNRVELDRVLKDMEVSLELVLGILTEIDKDPCNNESGNWRRRLGERQRLYDAPRRR